MEDDVELETDRLEVVPWTAAVSLAAAVVDSPEEESDTPVEPSLEQPSLEALAERVEQAPRPDPHHPLGLVKKGEGPYEAKEAPWHLEDPHDTRPGSAQTDRYRPPGLNPDSSDRRLPW